VWGFLHVWDSRNRGKSEPAQHPPCLGEKAFSFRASHALLPLYPRHRHNVHTPRLRARLHTPVEAPHRSRRLSAPTRRAVTAGLTYFTGIAKEPALGQQIATTIRPPVGPVLVDQCNWEVGATAVVVGGASLWFCQGVDSYGVVGTLANIDAQRNQRSVISGHSTSDLYRNGRTRGAPPASRYMRLRGLSLSRDDGAPSVFGGNAPADHEQLGHVSHTEHVRSDGFSLPTGLGHAQDGNGGMWCCGQRLLSQQVGEQYRRVAAWAVASQTYPAIKSLAVWAATLSEVSLAAGAALVDGVGDQRPAALQVPAPTGLLDAPRAYRYR
jgi:hypothetical protein